MHSQERKKRLLMTANSSEIIKADLVKQPKTKARSGIDEVTEALRAGADVSMIGQRDVIFDSAYSVTEEVLPRPSATATKRCIWESQTGDFFTVIRDDSGE